MGLALKHLASVLGVMVLLSGCGSSNSDNNTTTENNVIDDTPSVDRDTTSPVLETGSLVTGGQVAYTSLFAMEGNVTDDTMVERLTLELNGVTQDVEVTNGKFAIVVSLKGGDNHYQLTAKDTSDNSMTLSGSIYLGQRTAAGGSHSGAIIDGALYTWGRNNYGQSGLGYTSKLEDNSSGIHPNTPVQVTLPTAEHPVALSFNQNFSMALDASGNLWSWGYNKNGELGRGDSTDICKTTGTEPDCMLTMGQVEGMGTIVSVAAGYSHTLALKEDGTVWAFGSNNDGELGQGDTNSSNTPLQVQWEESVTIAQVRSGSDFSCALDDQGRLWAWGKNNYGQMGQGVEGDDQLTPIQVPFEGNATIVTVATGKGHVLALDTEGNVYGWGLNASSQVGYYGYQYKDTEGAWERYIYSPTVIVTASQENPVMNVFANGNSSYLLRADGKVYPWGQYGETDESGKTSYANLDFPEDKLTAITSVKDVAAGALHLVAIQEDDKVFTWRWSFEGSLGGGESTVDRWMYNYPIQPVFPE